MRRLFIYFSAFVFASFLFASCMEDEEVFVESDLVGKWQSGTEFYRYLADHTGKTWDTADDVDESEAQSFEWALEQSELTHIHIMETGGNITKIYTVTELTSNTLKYKDDFGKSFSFTKVGN